MIGSTPKTRWLLVLVFILFLSTGCQFVPFNDKIPQSVTKAQLETSSQELQNNFQQQLEALEKRQLARYKQQAQVIQQFKESLESYQQENLNYQRQHSFQIQQLGNLLEPGFATSPITEVVQNDGKMLLGQYEWVHLPLQGLVFPARIDSGANTSSLHAINLQQFERDGKSWVRFETLYQPDKEQPSIQAEIEAPLVRKVNVTQASGSETRPVVVLPVQLGSLTQAVEFTLTDRGNLVFPVLLGRRFFMDIAVIDVSKTYVQGKPEAPTKEPVKEPTTGLAL